VRKSATETRQALGLPETSEEQQEANLAHNAYQRREKI